MKSIYLKEKNDSKNPIPRKAVFKSVGHVKYEGQARSQHWLFCSILIKLSSCRVTNKNSSARNDWFF